MEVDLQEVKCAGGSLLLASGIFASIISRVFRELGVFGLLSQTLPRRSIIRRCPASNADQNIRGAIPLCISRAGSTSVSVPLHFSPAVSKGRCPGGSSHLIPRRSVRSTKLGRLPPERAVTPSQTQLRLLRLLESALQRLGSGDSPRLELDQGGACQCLSTLASPLKTRRTAS